MARVNLSTFFATKISFLVALACFLAHASADLKNYMPYSEFNYNPQAEGQKVAFFQKRELSLNKPYPGTWDFGGSAIVQPDLVRLTSNEQSQSGWLSCPIPVAMRHWEVQVQFRVHGSTGSLFGDGMAFWYVEPSNKFGGGPVFGNQNNFRGLGVFLDTYSNHNGPHSHDHPYLSAMISNGSVNYDHDKDGTHSQIAGCTVRFRNKERSSQLAISYVANTLTVSTDVEANGDWQRCFQVDGVHLPTHYVLGLSAMTGELVDNHDVVGVRVFQVETKESEEAEDAGIDYTKEEPRADAAEPERDRTPDQPLPSGAAWKLLLAAFFILIGIIVLAAVVYIYYRHKERNRKRFY